MVTSRDTTWEFTYMTANKNTWELARRGEDDKLESDFEKISNLRTVGYSLTNKRKCK